MAKPVGLINIPKDMVKRASIEFVQPKSPITGLVTKFGGQPDWATRPEWPLSKSTGEPMRFICQIAIDPQLFGPVEARMAYLFMTDEKHNQVVETWEPDGGENAVILQPAQNGARTQLRAEGPTLYQMVKKIFSKQLVPEACEYSANLIPAEDPDFEEWDVSKMKDYSDKLGGNKIGGTPFFIQDTEFPGPGKWHLLLQLDSDRVPFFVNFGDAGVGYVFLAEDGRSAKFLWQCF